MAGKTKTVKLNGKQRLFAHEYAVDQNATQAAIRAGYSAKTAGVQGHDLLKNPQIQALVAQRVNKACEDSDISIRRIVLELYRICSADPKQALDDDGKPLPLKDWPDDLARALASWEIKDDGRLHKYKFWSKTQAGEQLLRKLGAFKDTITIELSLGELIRKTVSESDED